MRFKNKKSAKKSYVDVNENKQQPLKVVSINILALQKGEMTPLRKALILLDFLHILFYRTLKLR